MDDRERTSSRDSLATCISIPFHLCVPSLEGTDHGSQSTNDDAVWSCCCAGVASETQQRDKVQMSILPGREPSSGCQESCPMNNLSLGSRDTKSIAADSGCNTMFARPRVDF